ncbi:hypothetical protein [Nostoc sp.]|uniref:hypothetical protein n=1 Tax=Nostoc sp. TaxID=1180 RepID=UPI002FF46F4B
MICTEPDRQTLLTVSKSDLSEYYAPIARAIALAIFISQQQEKFPPILTNAQFYRDQII